MGKKIKAVATEETEEFVDLKEDLEETMENVEDIKEEVRGLKKYLEEMGHRQKSILHRVSSKLVPEEFAWDDLAQQIVGAIILSTPLAVTQEVWLLSQDLDIFRVIAIFGITLLFNILLIRFTKYQLVKKAPLRIVSQMTVSYISAAALLFIFGVIGNQVTETIGIIKLVLFVGLFANIGAGTADILK